VERLQALFDGISIADLEMLNVDVSAGEGVDEKLDFVKHGLRGLPCETCEHIKECHTRTNKELKNILRRFRSLAHQVEGERGGVWVSFKRHLRFLKETGFADEMDRLTPDGFWAAKLRLDHPLLIAEAIRNGALSQASPEVTAGCVAPFVWDRVQELELKIKSPIDLKACEQAFDKVIHSIEHMRRLKVKRGFENPPIFFWPAAALYLWTKGVPWQELLSIIPIDEGDMTSLIARTADHLRQVTNLEETHPRLASVAHKAIEQILREPVFIQ
jgi:ATP-dependent RNA helicase HelY